MYFKNCCNFVNVIWNTLRFWLNNDNNDNIHAGAKFDVGGRAETSFLLTVALSINPGVSNLWPAGHLWPARSLRLARQVIKP